MLNWRKVGLDPIDGSKPILFHGSAVREFLKKHPLAMRSSPVYARFVLQVLRIALVGGYAHAKSPLSMEQILPTPA